MAEFDIPTMQQDAAVKEILAKPEVQKAANAYHTAHDKYMTATAGLRESHDEGLRKVITGSLRVIATQAKAELEYDRNERGQEWVNSPLGQSILDSHIQRRDSANLLLSTIDKTEKGKLDPEYFRPSLKESGFSASEIDAYRAAVGPVRVAAEKLEKAVDHQVNHYETQIGVKVQDETRDNIIIKARNPETWAKDSKQYAPATTPVEGTGKAVEAKR